MTAAELDMVDAVLRDIGNADGALLGRAGCGEAMVALRRATEKLLLLRGGRPSTGQEVPL